VTAPSLVTIPRVKQPTNSVIAIFVHLPWMAEIRQAPSVVGSRMAVFRAPHKKEWVDNIFDPWHVSRGCRHNSRGRRNFCPPTLEGGDPPRSLCRRLKDGGLPRSAQKRVSGQYFRSLARLLRTSQFLSTYLGWRRSAKDPLSTAQGRRSTALRTKKSRWTIFSIPGTVTADVAIFVHLPWRAEIRQGPSVVGSRMAVFRAPHKKE